MIINPFGDRLIGEVAFFVVPSVFCYCLFYYHLFFLTIRNFERIYGRCNKTNSVVLLVYILVIPRCLFYCNVHRFFQNYVLSEKKGGSRIGSNKIRTEQQKTPLLLSTCRQTGWWSSKWRFWIASAVTQAIGPLKTHWTWLQLRCTYHTKETRNIQGFSIKKDVVQ